MRVRVRGRVVALWMYCSLLRSLEVVPLEVAISVVEARGDEGVDEESGDSESK